MITEVAKKWDTLFLFNLWQQTSSEAPDGGHVSNVC